MWDGTNWVPNGSSICILQGKAESYTTGVAKVTTWTEVEDLDGYFGAGTVVDEQWVFPFTGRYRITYKIGFGLVTHTSFQWKVHARKDRGATTTEDNDHPQLKNQGKLSMTSLSIQRDVGGTGIVDAVANDETDLIIFQQANTRTMLTTGSYVYIEYLGPTP